MGQSPSKASRASEDSQSGVQEGERKRSQCSEPDQYGRKRPKLGILPIKVSIDNACLHDSLSFLTRWELDAIPMVNRQFRAAATEPEQRMKRSRFPQRRMIDNVYISRQSRSDNNRIWVDHCIFVKYRRVFAHGKIDETSKKWRWNTGHNEIRLLFGRERLAELIRHSPHLRARKTCVELDSFTNISEILQFRNVWDGCHLTVLLKDLNESQPTTAAANLLPELFHSCSSLYLGPYSTTVHPALSPRWESVGTELLLNALPCCSNIQIMNFGGIRGITFEYIVDYLFGGTTEKPRKLSISHLEYADNEWQNYTSARLKLMIEESVFPPLVE